MTDVRNQRLASAHYTDAASHILFSVPPSTVVILKAVLGNTVSVAGNIIFLIRSAGITDLYLLVQPSATVNTPYLWQGQLAMNPSDALIVAGPAGDTRYWASGAVLLGGPPFPTMPAFSDEPLPVFEQPALQPS